MRTIEILKHSKKKNELCIEGVDFSVCGINYPDEEIWCFKD